MSKQQPDLYSLLGVHSLTDDLAPGSYADLFELAVQQLQAGNVAQVRFFCDKILTQSVDDAGALQLMGLAAFQEKNYAQAVDCFAQSIKAKPDNMPAFFNMGQALLLSGHYALADKAFTRVLQMAPGMAAAHLGLGQALGYLGKFEAALQNLILAMDQTAKLSAHEMGCAAMHRGMALGALGKNSEAVQWFKQAISQAPQLAQAHFGLANALRALGQHDDAEQTLTQAITLDGNFAPAHFLRGMILGERQQYAEALQCFDRAIELAPRMVDAYYGRGLVWQARGEHGKAGREFSEALNINPDHVLCLHAMGNALLAAKQFEYALNAFRRAEALRPGFDYVAGMQAFLARQLGLWQHHEADLSTLRERLSRGEHAIEPFAALALFDEPDLHRQVAELYMQRFHAQAFAAFKPSKVKVADKIRIAYISSDFFNHATAYLMAGLLEQHDRGQFEIYALSFGANKQDAMRERIQNACDKFVDITNMSDAVVAEFCRHKNIQIAIDLKGLTRDSRPGIFARRAAPIQVNYLGYPGTMAAPCYDYMIADSVVIAPDQRQHYSEAIAYLPHSYQVNDQNRVISSKVQRRTNHGLPKTGFVFCCFNNHYKITPEIFASWMRMMAQVPDSVLWLLQGHEASHRNLRLAAEQHGIAPERLIFAPQLDQPEHLARLRMAQLSLDTLPYNAHTTASDALWVGVPHITCMGQSFASRVAASLLYALDMPELVTQNIKEYEALAVELALQPKRLQKTQRKLVNQISVAPLFNTALFARNIESAYCMMHQRWLAGEKPGDIRVEK